MSNTLRILLPIAFAALLLNANAQLAHPATGQPAQQESAAAFPAPTEHQSATLSYRIIDAPNGTFGYDILSDGKLLIHQTNVPGRPGNNGCPTGEQAKKLSALVMEKIQRGEMPPTVTTEELKNHGL
ncbi:MAG: DUF4907 domain-containing protein [Flavobacteriales bacterium]